MTDHTGDRPSVPSALVDAFHAARPDLCESRDDTARLIEQLWPAIKQHFHTGANRGTEEDQLVQYAIRTPGGIVMDPSPVRTMAEARLSRYRDQWPDAELVTRTVLAGEWAAVDTNTPISEA